MVEGMAVGIEEQGGLWEKNWVERLDARGWLSVFTRGLRMVADVI